MGQAISGSETLETRIKYSVIVWLVVASVAAFNLVSSITTVKVSKEVYDTETDAIKSDIAELKVESKMIASFSVRLTAMESNISDVKVENLEIKKLIRENTKATSDKAVKIERLNGFLQANLQELKGFRSRINKLERK